MYIEGALMSKSLFNIDILHTLNLRFGFGTIEQHKSVSLHARDI